MTVTETETETDTSAEEIAMSGAGAMIGRGIIVAPGSTIEVAAMRGTIGLGTMRVVMTRIVVVLLDVIAHRLAVVC
jgi:hypothetical protein